jgi:23S rRNA (cytosine1962-C5)-methyltransferase
VEHICERGRAAKARGGARVPASDAPVRGAAAPAAGELELCLRSGREKALRQGHPWIFSGAIANLAPSLPPGSPVRVLSASGDFLGRGYANPRCTIAVRLLTRRDEAVDRDFVRRSVAAAAALRRRTIAADTNAYRVVNGEGDGLPGFLVDRFADVLVLQCLTAGADRLRDWVVESLLAELAPRAIVECSRGAVRRAEGLEDRNAVPHGDPPGEIEVLENGVRMLVEPARGQKTGYFCDQRDNRALLRTIAGGGRVLDAFCYTGGFAVHAGRGGAAHVVAVDSSAPALERARGNWRHNGLDAAGATFVRDSAASFLRETSLLFDVLVLDPPALAKRRGDVARAARAYKDLQLWALRRAHPGALVLAFTCSQHVGTELFAQIAVAAASDAGRRLQILRRLGAGCDHPVLAAHPEGEYLRGLLLRVD